LKFWTLLIAGAISPFLFASTLSSTLALALLFLLPPTALLLNNRYRAFYFFPVFFLTTTLVINERISQRLPLSESRSSHDVSGIIGSLPEQQTDGVRFVFLPDVVEKLVPPRIRVYWYQDKDRSENDQSSIPELHAGERWHLQLELRSPRGRVNFHGFDTERWYFTQGIGALAYVKEGNNKLLADADWFDLQHWRELVLARLTETAGGVPGFRFLVALAIVDRRGLSARDRDILSATGTGHLLAISGLHIGLAAALGYYLGRLGLILLFTGLIHRVAHVLPWLLSWSGALAYAALSGFGVSTQRALVMLAVASVVLLSRRSVHPLLAWLIAMALVLLADPFAPLRAGFWFSFMAVAILMMLFLPRHGHMPGWRKMLYAQLGITLVMAPLGIYWFQLASLPGLLANLVAIPLVSIFIVPLILIALLLLWFPGPLSAWVLTIAGHLADGLFIFLEHISTLQPVLLSSTRVVGFTATVLAMLGAAILMLPRGMPLRFTGLILMFPLLMPTESGLGSTETQIDLLDVGQGLAVLLSTRDYVMLYDTGPGNGLSGKDRWDMVDGTIQPMIRATGNSPDLIIASHADLDHAGGLARLQTEYPAAKFLASLPEKRTGIGPCETPGSWLTGKLEFNILHPSPGLPYLGNDSSCVISVNGPGLSLLLSGDVSRVVEQRLVDHGLEPHTILTAPHHGSSTSSSQALIESVKPALVLISAASNNRFGFPREDVLQRYADEEIPALNTAECGGIRIKTDVNGGFSLSSARITRNAIWRWPADASCSFGR
jgi:competence protein ComEC